VHLVRKGEDFLGGPLIILFLKLHKCFQYVECHIFIRDAGELLEYKYIFSRETLDSEIDSLKFKAKSMIKFFSLIDVTQRMDRIFEASE
jgi:hypothetical protein